MRKLSKRVLTQSVVAGFLIGIGNICLMVNENKALGALLFSLALLSIISNGLPLYTGRIGKVFANGNPGECVAMLILNVVGCVMACLMFVAMNPSLNLELISGMADAKFQYGFLRLFVAGFMCNVLIHIAVVTKRDIVTVLCIMAFILCGFSHSIADSGYAFVTMNWFYIGRWLFILLGNTVGGIITEFLLNPKEN